MNFVHLLENNDQRIFNCRYHIILNIYNYVKTMDLFNRFQKKKLKIIVRNFVYIPPKIVKQEFKSKFSLKIKFQSVIEFRAKEKKLLEQSIAKLRERKHEDDEIKRQLYIEQIKWWIKQAEDDISALQG